MIVTALAIMCHVLSPSSLSGASPSNLGGADDPKCEPVVITDSQRTPDFTFLGCMMSQPAIAQWKTNHPIYGSDQWRVARVLCLITEEPVDTGRDI